MPGMFVSKLKVWKIYFWVDPKLTYPKISLRSFSTWLSLTSEIQVMVIYSRTILVTSECSVRGLTVKPGLILVLGYWQTVQTPIRRRRRRRLIRVCTVFLNYMKFNCKWYCLKSPLRTICSETTDSPILSVLWLTLRFFMLVTELLVYSH